MRLIVLVAVVALTAAPVLADWDPGDPHKMHYPQLPDMNGWDVRATYYVGVADDWTCTGTGPVTDFHIWASWKGDMVAQPEFIHTAIYLDDRTNPDFSRPGQEVWHYDWYNPAEYTVRYWGDGDQGWYDPAFGEVIDQDHMGVWQYNFDIDPANAFVQEAGNIYWLEISMKFPLGETALFGWKTSASPHHEDDAVWREITGGPNVWHEIRDPYTSESLDLAFVITPEPSTLGLLALGALAVVRRRS